MSRSCVVKTYGTLTGGLQTCDKILKKVCYPQTFSCRSKAQTLFWVRLFGLPKRFSNLITKVV